MKRWIKRAAGASADNFARLYDLFFPSEQVDPAKSEKLVQTCRQISEQESASSGNVENQWMAFRRQIRTQFANHGAKAFLRKPPLSHIIGLGNTATAFGSWKYLRRSTDWPRYQKVLRENSLGRPIRFFCAPSTGGNQIHHTSHACAFEQMSGQRIDQMRLIVEFGGGYGGFCRQVHRLGFCGTYIIYDLPELSALQRYFLSSLGFNVVPESVSPDEQANGIILLQDIQDLANAVNRARKTHSPSLFVATWSISEVPMPLRSQIMPIVNDFDHFLIAYQPEFGSMKNNEFFQSLVAGSARPEGWKHYPIPHNPVSSYLIR